LSRLHASQAPSALWIGFRHVEGPMNRPKCSPTAYHHAVAFVNPDRPAILYKYRSVEPWTFEMLRRNEVWFSRRHELNDPYDCVLELPRAIASGDLKQLWSFLEFARPYTPVGIRTHEDFIRACCTCFTPIDRLGMTAEYLRFTKIVELLRHERPSESWLQSLAFDGMLLVRELVSQTAVFCLCESAVVDKMWDRYSDKHRGYCIGYDVSGGFTFSEAIQPMRYTDVLPKIGIGEIIANPIFARENLIYVKTRSWSYEQEWRFATAGTHRTTPSRFSIAEIIFGLHMPARERLRIRESLRGQRVTFREVGLSARNHGALELRTC
jgi:hypothetical protein